MSRGFTGLITFKEEVKKKADETIRRVSWEAFEKLIVNSPVDVGNFRANWLVALNTAKAGDPKNYRGKAGTAGTIQSQRSTNPGVAKGSSPTALEKTNAAPLFSAKLGDTIYITNNLEYADQLENGRSPQAPSGVLYVSAQQIKALYS